MPTFGLKLADLVDRRLRRRNTRILLGYLAFVATVVTLEALLFQFLMIWAEGRSYSLVTSIYWVLSTMSTLGLGDIVFTSTIGHFFTSLVLISGIVLLLILLPFSVVQFFFAPWLASRTIPNNVTDHVIITGHGDLARPLVEALELHQIPHFLVEPDPTIAAQLEAEGVPVVARPLDEPGTYRNLRIEASALVVLDGTDAENTASTLQIRELTPKAHIAAVASSEHGEEILRLAGANRVLPLKRLLGRHLAARISSGRMRTHAIGRFRNLIIAELPVRGTPLVGKTLRELDLRAKFGVNVVGVLEQTQFNPIRADEPLGKLCIPVVMGTREQIDALNSSWASAKSNDNPVLILGGGAVGNAAWESLQKRGVAVTVVDLYDPPPDWEAKTNSRWIVGDASDRRTLELAGITDAPSILLTTSDDPTNIYLALQCSHVAPDVPIVSRVTHERNLQAVRRAGAQIALSHTSLGVSSVFAALHRRDLVILGEGVELHKFPVPEALLGTTLGQSEIAERTGLNVIAVEKANESIESASADSPLAEGDSLLIIGAPAQLEKFIEEFA